MIEGWAHVRIPHGIRHRVMMWCSWVPESIAEIPMGTCNMSFARRQSAEITPVVNVVEPHPSEWKP